MTPPPAEVTGSYGAAFERWWRGHPWLEEAPEPMWWQRLAARRVLEHDVDGVLVWRDWLLTLARQCGKSVLLQALALFRFELAKRYGERQRVVHVANKTRTSNKIQEDARAFAKGNRDSGWSSKELLGASEVNHPNGSSWLALASTATYGFTSSLAMVDEAWEIEAAVVENGVAPTLRRRRSPQLGLISTAHPDATSLVIDRRRAALGGSGTLLIEWSSPLWRGDDDREGWRMATPAWTSWIEADIEKALLSARTVRTTLDDPLETFRAQYLNRWPVRVEFGVVERGHPLLPVGLWAELEADLDPEGPVTFAIDDVGGEAVVLAICGRSGELITLEAYRLPGDRRPAYEWIRTQTEVRGSSTLVIGASLKAEAESYELPVRLQTAGAAESKSALSLLRQVANRRGLRHAGSPDLAEQVDAVRVSPTAGGLYPVGAGDFSLLKVAAWAVASVEVDRRGAPSVW
jgi:hypothetical protein